MAHDYPAVAPIPVLIADDDVNDWLLIEVAFAKARVNAALHFVHDGQEAIEYLDGKPPFNNRKEHPVPRLLIVDLKMPRVSGLEFLQWLSRQQGLPKICVAVLTGSVAPAEVMASYALGADACLSKPCALDKFAALVQELWSHLHTGRGGASARHRDWNRYRYPENLFALSLHQDSEADGSQNGPHPPAEPRLAKRFDFSEG